MAFWAGVYWVRFARLRRDINRIGNKVQQFEKIVLLYVPEQYRKEVITLLLGPKP